LWRELFELFIYLNTIHYRLNFAGSTNFLSSFFIYLDLFPYQRTSLNRIYPKMLFSGLSIRFGKALNQVKTGAK